MWNAIAPLMDTASAISKPLKAGADDGRKTANGTKKGKTMAENYKHLYEQTKKMLTMYQDELIPGFRKKVEELEAKVATDNNVGSKWIPVTERLPERGAEVIVCSHRTIKPVVFATYFWDAEHENWQGITHWMPLPQPPKGE